MDKENPNKDNPNMCRVPERAFIEVGVCGMRTAMHGSSGRPSLLTQDVVPVEPGEDLDGRMFLVNASKGLMQDQLEGNTCALSRQIFHCFIVQLARQ